ncbi:MAG: hypothetical protein U0N20_06740 [Clostridium sp.]
MITNYVLKSIILSGLTIFSIFIVDCIFYKIGAKEEKNDAFWYLSLFLALVIFQFYK